MRSFRSAVLFATLAACTSLAFAAPSIAQMGTGAPGAGGAPQPSGATYVPPPQTQTDGLTLALDTSARITFSRLIGSPVRAFGSRAARRALRVPRAGW